MNLTERSNLEKEAAGTESGLTPNKILYALLLSGGIVISPAMNAAVPYTTDLKNVPGTTKLINHEVSITTKSEKDEARSYMVNRMRLLRNLSIREGVSLLSAEQISEEVRMRRGEL